MNALAHDPGMSHAQLVERYYEAIDENDDEVLESVLAPAFRHDRPDRTLEGRDRFIEFMLEERPTTDTVHAVDTLFLPEEQPDDAEEVAVHGRLFNTDGTEQFAFVDLFTIGDDGVTQLRTFTK